MLGRAIRRWWAGEQHVGASDARANILIGAACLMLAALDVRLGLGTYGRWMLAVPFGLLPLGWGLAARRLGGRAETARPLRLAGDLLFWASLVLFAVLGLAVADGETGPLLTLVGFAVGAAVVATVRALRRHPGRHEGRLS